MSYTLRHVDRNGRCAVKLDGMTIVFSWKEGGQLHHKSVVLDVSPVQCRVDVAGNGVRWAVVSDQAGQAVLVREDTGEKNTIAPNGIGAGMAHLRGMAQGCEVYLQQDGRVNVYHESGFFKHHLEMQQASEGIHHIEEDGTPISEDQARGPRQFNGEPMWRIDEHHGKALGQVGDPDGMGFQKDGKLYSLIPAVMTQQSSFFGVRDNGEVWFACPGESPEPWDYTMQLRHDQEPPGPIDPPVDPANTVSTKVVHQPMFYSNGDMKMTLRVPKGELTTPKVGDTVKVVDQ